MPPRGAAPIPLHILTDGSGPPLLLLPGFACSGETWGVAFVRTLAGRFTVLRGDWPGTGRSSPINGALTIPRLVCALTDVLDTHAVSHARLLGWGLGAMVALQFAIDRPETVERLVLIGGAMHGGALLARWPTVAALCSVAGDASPEEHMLGLLGRLVRPAWRPFAELLLPQLLPRPAATLAALRGQWDALAGYDLSPRLAALRVPTLVLVGDHDELTPPEVAGELVAAVPGACLNVVADAGHAVVWEQPAATLAAILPFLDGGVVPSPEWEAMLRERSRR
jgi:3-oxoadipate enol-lactonase